MCLSVFVREREYVEGGGVGKYRKPRDLSGLMLSAIRLGVITLKARSIESRRLQSTTPLSGARGELGPVTLNLMHVRISRSPALEIFR